MNGPSRRQFLEQAAVGGLAAVAAAPAAGQTKPAGDRVVVGLIGVGGMGGNHVQALAARKDVEIAWLCDVDKDRLSNAASVVQRAGGTPQTAADMRRVLDDRRVQAVWVATPDHWHAPAALLALNAGKHVYVEKPMCHNYHEGRLLVDAVRRSGKHLQVGTQSRSAPFLQEALDRIRRGEIGDVLVAKAWNSQRRGSIGKTQPSQPPAALDFDLWLGPAPTTAYRSNLLPSSWRWWYDFGCGDIGNDGVHDIDVACWGLGIHGPPATVACLGGKYYFDDDQQFPDTQYAVCEYPVAGKPGVRKQLIFEQRIWSPYVQEGYENGAAFYGTSGMLIVGHSVGWKLYGPRNKLLAERTGSPNLEPHHTNFLDCVRGKSDKPNADVTAGFAAASVVHLANISARVRRTLEFDATKEEITHDPPATTLLRRTYRAGHWATPRG